MEKNKEIGDVVSLGIQPKARSLIISGNDFIDNLIPPEYIVKPLLQRGQVVSLTAQTNHGKSALASLLSIACLSGLKLSEFKSKKSKVLLMLGENAENAKLQLKATCLANNVSTECLANLFIYPIGKPIRLALRDIFAEAKSMGELSLVNVDTSAAYFGGSEENSNSELREHASLLRELTKLPGNPSVLINCHPTKNATRDSLLPRGGGAFLAEIDSNLTLWNDNALLTVGHTKMRGPPFDPIILTLSDQKVVFSDGSSQMVPVATPIGDGEEMEIRGRLKKDEMDLIKVMSLLPGANVSRWATEAGWLMPSGAPYKMKVLRILKRMQGNGRIKQGAYGEWVVCKKGGKVEPDDNQ